MRVRDLLGAESIELQGKAATKKEVIEQMVQLMAKRGNINDLEKYEKGVFAREEEGTTGIGEGIAIPHCKSDAVSAPGLAAMVLPQGVDYDALDGQPVHIIFLIAAPDTKDNIHLDVLSRLSVLLMDEEFTKALQKAATPEEFLDVIDRAEKAKDEEEQRKQEQKAAAEAAQKNGADNGNAAETGKPAARKKVVAVTGCPTGIAHTYMAAEALEKAGEKMGIDIKVETRGSGGAKNVLTDQEIAEAEGIIVAADTKVPMDRFDGRQTLSVKVADGISKPEELIETVLDHKAEIYHAAGGHAQKEEADTEEKAGVGHMIYTHLMSGVSHMLPFVIGGGIMTALAFLIDTLLGYGTVGGAAFGTCTPISAFFKYVGGLSMGLMVPVLAGYIAYSIADRPGLAVGFTGGLLAANGNALVTDYDWGSLNGFQQFVANFAFQGENGGTTVSGFLGGILVGFLAGFVVLMLKKLCSKLPDSLEGIKPTLIYPLIGILIVSVLMCFIFNPLIGLVNTGLSAMLSALASAGLITLLGVLLGAMMAIDMGGPINKAAYVFGTGMLATASDLMASGAQASDPTVQACYIAMASIMVGGMVPPIGIALACQFFPKKFTAAERDSRVSNLVMGCSFITEGAIPFAASDPVHVIPCTLVGAGIAGGLSAFFGCTLMAPHGGIFVFATVGKPFLYILAWIIGSIVTAVMLGFIKKDASER